MSVWYGIARFACLSLLVTVVGCSKGESGEPTSESETAASEARVELALLESDVAAGATHGELWTKCLSARSSARRLAASEVPEHQQLVATIRARCTYELPIAEVEARLAEAASERKARPDVESIMIPACGRAALPLDLLREGHPEDNQVKALVARHRELCPE